MRRRAAGKLHIDGKVFTQYVVELDEDGNVINTYPLTKEISDTEWHNEFFVFRKKK